MNTESPAYIAVSPDAVETSLNLRRTTALIHCTMVDALPDAGQIKINRAMHSLSDGEQLLWQTLAALSGQADLPSDYELEAWLDAENYAAVRAVLDAGDGRCRCGMALCSDKAVAS